LKTLKIFLPFLLTGLILYSIANSKPNKLDLKKDALISVYDKTNVADFAKELSHLGYTLLSTGGTAKIFKKADLPIFSTDDYSEVIKFIKS